MSDWYEESEELETWRKAMGMSNVIYTVVLSLEVYHHSYRFRSACKTDRLWWLQKQEIEEWWHLILPPLLTFLDDFDARNKLTGTYILSTLLAKVDANLLRRTGVGLIFTQVRIFPFFRTLLSHIAHKAVIYSHWRHPFQISIHLIHLLSFSPLIPLLYNSSTFFILSLPNLVSTPSPRFSPTVSFTCGNSNQGIIV